MEKDLKQELNWPSDRKFANLKEKPKIIIREGSWLTHPLWYEYGWNETLQDKGISWSEFRDIYDSVRFHFLRWRENEERWDSAMEKFVEEVQEKIESKKESGSIR
mgnify:CR=1 FL=1